MNERFHHLKDVAVSFVSNFPMEVGVNINWPNTVDHSDGLTYFFYDKVAVNERKRPNMPCACYRCLYDGKDKRIWVHADGKIQED